MDPLDVTSRRATRWLPRARGDGPRENIDAGVLQLAPPRSRGWTPDMTGTAVLEAGSPALAGMDPRRALHGRRWRWLPRARGDGPVLTLLTLGLAMAPPRSRGWTPSRARALHDGAGSPALAGMDPLPDPDGPASWRLPRARGDGPRFDRAPCCSGGAPPRSRGWTHSASGIMVP